MTPLRVPEALLGRMDVPVYSEVMVAHPPPSETSPPPSDASEGSAFWFQLFNEIGIISQLSTSVLENALPDGLKAADFRVLNHFMRLGGPRTPVQLARSFQVTKGTMTHTIQKMSGLGLITIVPHGDDGRSKWVDITQAGRDAHAKALARLGPDMESVFSRLHPTVKEELHAALPALAALRNVLDKARD